uniref:C2H2-type domain-containing protein n=1 Tax=Labrus bergylta TaxID=56723 RepID=A0A3Q3GY49_9LABR
MANTTLQSFNVFLTERLTAAAVDIYGFVEKTIIDYQDEVYPNKTGEPEVAAASGFGLQTGDKAAQGRYVCRHTDSTLNTVSHLTQVFFFFFFSFRAATKNIFLSTVTDASPNDFPTPTQEVCAQEQQTQRECVPSEEPLKEEQTESWTRSGGSPGCPAYGSVTGPMTQMVRVGEREENQMRDTLSQAATAGEHSGFPEPDNLIRVVTVGDQFEYENQSQEEQPLPSYRTNFDCHICGKHIPCQSNLQNHMRVHTGERPYSCHFCGKCFKLKGHMTEHIRTHTGEKPFSCHICDKSFNRGSTLRKHVLAKHKEERPYKCGDCDELFTERLLMKRHMRKGAEYCFV